MDNSVIQLSMKPIDKKPPSGKNGRPDKMAPGLTEIERRVRAPEFATGTRQASLTSYRDDKDDHEPAEAQEPKGIQRLKKAASGTVLPAYKYRDPEKRRAYMREKMRERRAK